MRDATWRDPPTGLLTTALYFTALPILLILAAIGRLLQAIVDH